MINFQAPAPAYMLRQNGQTVFAQPAGGAIFTSPMHPSQRGGMNGLGSFDASAPTLVDPVWQQSLRIAPTYAAAQPMMFTDAQMLQAQQMAAGAGSGMHIVNTSPSLAPSPASLSPVAPFQPFAAPIQHSDPMAAAREAAAREEIAQREARAQGRRKRTDQELREEIAQREAEATGILFDRPIDGGDVLARLAKEKYERKAQQRHQAYLAQEAAAEEARRQLAANAPPVEQNNTLLWVGLGAAAFGVAWWMMSGKGAAA